MASVNELINLSQYQAGDYGREGLNGKGMDFSGLPGLIKSPQQKQAEQMSLSNMAADLVIKQAQAAIAKKQQELWDGIGKVKNNNKTTRGIAENVVDNEEAGGRDIVTVGEYQSPEGDSGYEAEISKSGKMRLSPKGQDQKSYDRVKVIDRAKKLAEQDLIMNGLSAKLIKASDFSTKLKQFIPQAEIDLYGEATTKPEESKIPTRSLNPTGETSSAEDFLPQYKENRGMIDVAKDFYFGAKPQRNAIADKHGFYLGEIKQSSKGRVKYIGNNKWQKVD